MQQPQRPRRGLRTSARIVGVAGLILMSACDDSATAPRDTAWSGERIVRTAGGTAIQTRIDRAATATSTPTIVLVSGLDTPLELWSSVRASLAQDAPVFSFDRGGVGRSGAVSGNRSSQVVASELRDALTAAGARPPYLLVAHSVGGLHARVFASRYPDDVAGLVLVDATHETLLELLDEASVEEIAASQQYLGSRLEVRSQRQSIAEVRARPLPDIPLSIITSMKAEPGQDAAAREWFAALQAEWLQQVTRGEQRRSSAGHMIPLEAPLEIVDATRRVLAWIREAR